MRSVTVVGGGLAGFTTARELRAGGYDGALRIVDPQGTPYDRPPLSKAVLLGRSSGEDIRLAPPGWYEENAVEVLTDRVAKLSPSSGGVLLASGGELSSDAVVLATGGAARPLTIPGGDHPAVRVLRELADAEELRARLEPGSRLVVIGAGLIGAEVASSATQLGASVTLVDPVPVPLVPAVGPELAEVLHAMHAQRGVRVVQGRPSRITAYGPAVLVEVPQDGAAPLSLPADVVLSATGITVDTSLAEAAGLAVREAVITGLDGRTSNPAVYAAGDSARRRGADGSLLRRSEHWESALLDGTAVARSLLGLPAQERQPGWFWSDRYGVHAEAAGAMSAPGSTVLRAVDGAPRLAFRLSPEGRLLGCAGIDSSKAVRAARRLIARGARVRAEDLRDPAVDLKKLGRE
ncbi:3-phenylpropionate/trans-cinnamate dioxygenase ferredoxin reductase component [Streptomyces albus]|nr:3-phenylpropionate/trans-cinnamate dioxygenase ferredoxin reductase component [Streptomyces albus]